MSGKILLLNRPRVGNYLRVKPILFRKTVWVKACTKAHRSCTYLPDYSWSTKVIVILWKRWNGCLVYSGVRLLTNLKNRIRHLLQRLRLSDSHPSSLDSFSLKVPFQAPVTANAAEIFNHNHRLNDGNNDGKTHVMIGIHLKQSICENITILE